MSAATRGFKFKQDMPPKGGYDPVFWKRTFPKTWLTGYKALAGIGVFTVWGFFQHKYSKAKMMMLRVDEIDTKCALQPFWYAEHDRNWLAFLRKNHEEEAEVMKDVPGWQAGTWYGEPVYFSTAGRWIEPGPTILKEHATLHRLRRERFFDDHHEYCAPKWYDKYMPQVILDHVR